MIGHNLYSILTRFGSCYPIDLQFSVENIVKELEEKYEWIRYNPRKKIDRFALSVVSQDGGMSGIPDLDSLYEYYDKTGVRLTENDFKAKTEVYPYFAKWLDPFGTSVSRTHIIKMGPGGFFPWHRDSKYPGISAFRLFLPIKFPKKSCIFLLEDTPLKFDDGTFYFIDTAKMHTLCNVSPTDTCYFLVANIELTKEAIDAVCSKMLG